MTGTVQAEKASGATARPLVTYRGLGFTFSIATDDAVLRHRAQTLLRPLRDGGNPSEAPAATLIIGRDGASSTFESLGAGSTQFRSDGELIDHLQWFINSRVIDEVSDRGTGLHAAAVQRGEQTWLCPAASEAGKSTLAALLVRAGWTYLSDEAIELAGDCRLVPFPKAITLDAGSQAHFPEVRPHVDDTASWYVDPEAWGSRPAYRPAPPTAVVLPEFLLGAAPEVRPLPAGEALLRLAPATFLFGRGPRRNLAALGVLVQTTPAFSITYGSPEGVAVTARQLQELLS